MQASLVAQTIKNLPATQETPGEAIPGEGDPLKKGMATHSSILPWSLGGYSHKELTLPHFHFFKQRYRNLYICDM